MLKFVSEKKKESTDLILNLNSLKFLSSVLPDEMKVFDKELTSTEREVRNMNLKV